MRNFVALLVIGIISMTIGIIAVLTNHNAGFVMIFLGWYAVS